MALRITEKLLDKYHACDAGVKLMKRFYPDGADSIEVINDNRIPISFLHWGYNMLPIGREEVEAYLSRVGIKGCESFYECEDCTDSKSVVSSKGIHNSSYIFNCLEVEESQVISGSSKVNKSRDIYNSKQITRCEKISNCTSLTDCKGSTFSSYSRNSEGLYQSEFCFYCRNLINCKQMLDCEFCANCSNLKNSLFCFGIENGENLIFNKPASDAVIEMARAEFQNLPGGRLLHLTDDFWTPKAFNINPTLIVDYREMYSSFSEEFWEFVTHLPNFDSQLLYNITFLSRFIQNT